MKFFGMGGFELVIILVVILLIFGPKNLPKLGNALGKTVSNLRSGMNEGKKKKGEESETSEDAAPQEDEPQQAQQAEIVGEVETFQDDIPEPEEQVSPAEAAESEELVQPSDEPRTAPADEAVSAEGEGEEAPTPKKVRRVVKKKVVNDSAKSE